MKKLVLSLAAMLSCLAANADTNPTVTIKYDGTSATITIPSEASSYVTCTSGSSSHVKIEQSSTADNNPGEIIYKLSGSSDDGEFYLTGEYKTTLQLDGLTLTNPDSTAIHIKNGKRIKISMVSGTESTLVDGTSDTDSKGCLHSKGHTEFVGKGTLNLTSNISHAIYSKEYVEVKNCSINIKGAKNDGIHCQQYFKMTSGAVSISDVADEGIRVELKGETPTAGSETEDEDTGNFYMAGGSLTINNVGEYCIKTDGTISYTGGNQNFTLTNVQENAATAIQSVQFSGNDTEAVFDLSGRQLPKDALRQKGIYIVRSQQSTRKVIVK